MKEGEIKIWIWRDSVKVGRLEVWKDLKNSQIKIKVYLLRPVFSGYKVKSPGLGWG